MNNIDYVLLREQLETLEKVTDKEVDKTKENMVGIENLLSDLLKEHEEEYTNNQEFVDFVDSAFDESQSLLQDRADFAFGSMEKAIESFEQMKGEEK